MSGRKLATASAVKISFMTTLGVNVGDEFIREGIFSILDEVLEKWIPFYVNKVDLSSLSEHREDETTKLNDKFRDADVIIQAGAPVYWNLKNSTSYNVEWAEELWQNRIFQLGSIKPILNIAAGSCQPYPDFSKTYLSDPNCSQFAMDVGSACIWTSVRDPLASQILFSLGLEHDVLPCTAFHAARRVKIKPDCGDIIGINLMPLGGHYKLNNDVDEGLWKQTIEAFLTRIRKHLKIQFIAHDISEASFIRGFLGPGETIFYSSNWRDYLPIYAKCSATIANRVHGAVCAAGFGRPSLILGNDTRLLIGDYIGIPSRYIGDVSSEEIVELLEIGLEGRKWIKDRLITLREESATRYREAIAECLESFPGKSNTQIVRKGMNRNAYKSHLSLSSTKELSSTRFRDFMKTLNCFSKRHGLNQYINWSKIWEYPWLWFNGLGCLLSWKDIKLLDIGSELSPMAWFLASLGVHVTLVEVDDQWIPAWENVKMRTKLPVDWYIVDSDRLPFSDNFFDVITSFSVIEHQHDKHLAINEIARCLKPKGMFAMSFDICEPDMDMTFPEWNGKALTMREFEDLVWENPAFDNGGCKPQWNVDDCAEFIKWHLQSALHHNYVVGAAVLRKAV